MPTKTYIRHSLVADRLEYTLIETTNGVEVYQVTNWENPDYCKFVAIEFDQYFKMWKCKAEKGVLNRDKEKCLFEATPRGLRPVIID